VDGDGTLPGVVGDVDRPLDPGQRAVVADQDLVEAVETGAVEVQGHGGGEAEHLHRVVAAGRVDVNGVDGAGFENGRLVVHGHRGVGGATDLDVVGIVDADLVADDAEVEGPRECRRGVVPDRVEVKVLRIAVGDDEGLVPVGPVRLNQDAVQAIAVV